MNQASESKEYFQKVASGWDNLRKTFFFDCLGDRAIAVAKVTKQMTAVDVGCGTGFVSSGLVKVAGRVIGIDNSSKMLKVAQKNLSGYKNFSTRLGEIENLPLAANSAERVFANMVLHHAFYPDRAIREWVRILKPNGILIITDADQHHHQWLKTEQHDLHLGFDRNQIRQWLKAVGLKQVSVGSAQEKCCPTSQKGERVSISIFLASGIKDKT